MKLFSELPAQSSFSIQKSICTSLLGNTSSSHSLLSFSVIVVVVISSSRGRTYSRYTIVRVRFGILKCVRFWVQIWFRDYHIDFVWDINHLQINVATSSFSGPSLDLSLVSLILNLHAFKLK